MKEGEFQLHNSNFKLITRLLSRQSDEFSPDTSVIRIHLVFGSSEFVGLLFFEPYLNSNSMKISIDRPNI